MKIFERPFYSPSPEYPAACWSEMEIPPTGLQGALLQGSQRVFPESDQPTAGNQVFLGTPNLTRIFSIKHHFVNADCKRLRPTNAVKKCQ
jgi:hypothetical protein